MPLAIVIFRLDQVTRSAAPPKQPKLYTKLSTLFQGTKVFAVEHILASSTVKPNFSKLTPFWAVPSTSVSNFAIQYLSSSTCAENSLEILSKSLKFTFFSVYWPPLCAMMFIFPVLQHFFLTYCVVNSEFQGKKILSQPQQPQQKLFCTLMPDLRTSVICLVLPLASISRGASASDSITLLPISGIIISKSSCSSLSFPPTTNSS
mmetsp:Transcript_33205/g.58566  ORF Transcript_33205/g.58566 Transcript_33205/m.58566 type:complete len:205 (-) Transcript_33205:153-767(-)